MARVRARNEKALARELAGIEVGYYLPMLTRRVARRDTGKCRKSLVCAFPGYVPLVGYPERRADILRLGRIVNVMRVVDQQRFVAELDRFGSRWSLRTASTCTVGSWWGNGCESSRGRCGTSKASFST